MKVYDSPDALRVHRGERSVCPTLPPRYGDACEVRYALTFIRPARDGVGRLSSILMASFVSREALDEQMVSYRSCC